MRGADPNRASVHCPKLLIPYVSISSVEKATGKLALIVISRIYRICTNPLSLRAAVNDRTSIGHTVMQIPHPMQQLLALFSSSCFNANCITSMPTWQFRLHSPHAMHLSLD